MKLWSNIKSQILCLTFTPDGRSLLATSRGCLTIGIWDVASGNFRRWHPWADTRVRSLAFSADGTFLAVGNEWGMVLPYFWAAKNYDSECYCEAPIDGMAFAPDRSLLAVAAYKVSLWELGEDRSEPWGLLLGDNDSYRAVGFAPDGKTVAGTQYTEAYLDLWPLDNNRKATEDDKQVTSLPDLSSSLAFAPDGKTLAVASGSTVLLHNPPREKSADACTATPPRSGSWPTSPAAPVGHGQLR